MKPDVAARPTDRRPHGLALANAFTMPVVSPMSVPPPYRYRGCRAVNILFRTDPGALEPLVPAPLQVDPDQPSVLYIGHFELADFDMPYNEAGLLVPVVGKGMTAGSFAVVLYLDRANPISPGPRGRRQGPGAPARSRAESPGCPRRPRGRARRARSNRQALTSGYDPASSIHNPPFPRWRRSRTLTPALTPFIKLTSDRNGNLLSLDSHRIVYLYPTTSRRITGNPARDRA